MNNQNDGQANLSFLLHNRLDLTGKTGVERQLPDLMVVDQAVRADLTAMATHENLQQGFITDSATFPWIAIFDGQALI